MPLHNKVGINCKKGATTEYQGADVKYIVVVVVVVVVGQTVGRFPAERWPATVMCVWYLT